MLTQNREHFREKCVGLVLIASPSFGSKWADRLKLIANFYNHTVGAQLQWGSWSLRQLDRDFKKLLHERQIPELHGVEACENHFGGVSKVDIDGNNTL
jgi:hypothetical protein